MSRLAHMFWAYGDIGKLERICSNSFIANGYKLNLWTYGDISNASERVIIRDAREILPEKSVFLNLAGSYAGFSDLFRYAVLNKFGGLYTDTDVIAIASSLSIPTDAFLVTERVRGSADKIKINGNVLFNPTPKDGNIIDLALAYSMKFPKTDITWGEIGPDLLTAIVTIYKRHGFLILEPDFSNPINYWDCPKKLLNPECKLSQNSKFLHCYNEMWRRLGCDKNSSYPAGSIMSEMENKYLQM